jgi:hypothetical protein
VATSDVQICSNALLLLGAQTINSFSDDSDRALIVANLWPNCRDAVLRSHPWNCAIKRASLAPDVDPPAFEYAYQFLLPGDCLRVLALGEEGDTLYYRIEARRIVMDEAECKLKYIFRNEDVTTWDSLLVSACEAYIAMLAAYPVTKSPSVREQMEKLYAYQLRQARTVDALEEPTEGVGDFPLLSVRR